MQTVENNLKERISWRITWLVYITRRRLIRTKCHQTTVPKKLFQRYEKFMNLWSSKSFIGMGTSDWFAKLATLFQTNPVDCDRFIYKCRRCQVGFKRRGMLVNHLAKRHPDVPPDSVPELSLPILRQTRDYYCQYCDKVRHWAFKIQKSLKFHYTVGQNIKLKKNYFFQGVQK